jgi:hypothetical protein
MSAIETMPTRRQLEDAAGYFMPGTGRPTPDWAAGDHYPRMFNLSAGNMYRRIVAADRPSRTEYVTLRLRPSDTQAMVMVAQWNSLWESAQFRRRHFDEADMPAAMRRVADRGDVNVIFLPRTITRYHEYAPLFHLLPARTLKRHGLPLIRAGSWPYSVDRRVEEFLPSDFEARLAGAWADAVWRHLLPGSPMSGFTRDDPIRLLAHNLDFWLPPATEVITQILATFPPVGREWQEPESAVLTDGSTLGGALVTAPRKGGEIWRGSDDARETLEWVIETADHEGRLRSILDSIRSNRASDDFSSRWTFEREDFERKLHHKRAKTKVAFIEIPDTTPVHGPDTEVVGTIGTSAFLATLDPKSRSIVVLLHSGYTQLGDIAGEMGYANHSPISKRLAQIRRQAARHFDQGEY